jgi:hypothetical protein
MDRDVTLSTTVQIELDNVIQKDTAVMNEEQLRTHIQEVNKGLIALSQLPTTSRLHDLLQAKESAKDAEVRASALGKELVLTQQRVKELEEKAPECNHEGMEEKIRDLEQQLERRAPDQAEMARDLEDAQAQLEVMRKSAEEYREQVTRILRLTEGRTGGGGQHEEREEKGSEIARFSGENRQELRGWKVQLALKIAGKPKTYDTEQKKLRYAVGRLEKVALAQIMPYCDEVSGEVKLDSLKVLVDMLELAFGDQDKAATAKRELLKLKQRDREFSQYYAEFQRYVADVKWNAEAQMDALRNGLSNELKDSLQHADLPDNIVDFVKMCSKRDSQIRARVAERKSGRWEGGYKKPDNTNNTTSAPEVSPAGTVAGYHGPAPMDLSALKGKKITPEERKRRREGGLCMYCGDSRHFAASCPRKLKAASGQVEINPFKKDLGKDQDEGKGKEVESGKV